MIVPDFWAEARRQHRDKGKQVTVRRYGWSEISEDEARVMAEARVDEALKSILAGENLNRREARVAYNGADGLPIREEVLERHPFGVVTRNVYGAWCLNTEKALFADIDFDHVRSSGKAWTFRLALLGLAVLTGILTGQWALALGLAVGAWFMAGPLTRWFFPEAVRAKGGPDTIARQKLDAFLSRNPAWNVRLYRTPAGFRVLATHRPFEPGDPEVPEFFNAVSTDPLYVRMCANQKCFRARLTGKPWRMGITEPMKPRPGVWPVAPEHLERRNAWVQAYEARFSEYAACHFLDSLGSGEVHESIRPVIELHDRLCRAMDTSRVLA